MELKELSSSKIFGGFVKRFSHQSSVLGCEMKFSVFIPPAAVEGCKVPAVFWLSGLTCTDENFTTKSGAQRYAAALNLVLIAPDTSPRGLNLPGESDSWDFGAGAGFYLTATQEPWAKNYNMYDYIIKELVPLVDQELPVIPGERSISGHSMGGHGALTIFLKNPGLFKYVSAFAPICNPINCPWGKKAFTGYLGPDENTWKDYDATELMKKYTGPKVHILVDQGDEDSFLKQKQLLPEAFEAAGSEAGLPVMLRLQPGYDHSYNFIATFIGEHLETHAKHLAV